MSTIHLATAFGARPIRARTFGSWAVHRCVRTDAWDGVPPGWAVTHVPSGLSLSHFVHDLKREDAIRIARDLDNSGFLRDDTDPQESQDQRLLLMAIVGASLAGDFVRGRR